MELVNNNSANQGFHLCHQLSAAMQRKAVNGKEISTAKTFVNESDAKRLREEISTIITNADKHNF